MSNLRQCHSADVGLVLAWSLTTCDRRVEDIDKAREGVLDVALECA